MRIWAALERLRVSGDRAVVGVFDQGFLQCLGSVFPATLPQDEVYDLTHAAIRAMHRAVPDLTVFVNIDAGTAARRIRQRPYQRTMFDMARDDVVEQLEPHRRYVEETLPRVLAALGARTLHVSGFTAPDDTAEFIARQVLRAGAGAMPLASSGPEWHS
jgi:hypothetical protein